MYICSLDNFPDLLWLWLWLRCLWLFIHRVGLKHCPHLLQQCFYFCDDITYIVSPDQPHGLSILQWNLDLWEFSGSVCEFQEASESQSGSLQFWRSVWDPWERLWNVLYQKNHSMKQVFLQSDRQIHIILWMKNKAGTSLCIVRTQVPQLTCKSKWVGEAD